MGDELHARITLVFAGRMVELPPGTYVMGRSSSCALRFNDPNVSRRHVEFAVSRTGLKIRDLGSKNGTRVNGLALTRQAELAHGDTIELGRAKVNVVIQPESAYFEEDTISITDQRLPILDGSDDLVSCPNCNAGVPENLDNCPHCGCLVAPGRGTHMTQELPLFDPEPEE